MRFPALAALSGLVLVFVSCQKDPAPEEPRKEPDSIPQVDSQDLSDGQPDTATPESRTAEILSEASPEGTDSLVSRARARIASLREEWDANMGEAKVLDGFTRHAWDFPLPSVAWDSRTVLAKRLLEVAECGGDWVFDVFYANGDVDLGSIEGEQFFLSDSFSLEGGLRWGMSSGEVRKILGAPYRDADGFQAYAVQDWGEMEYSQKVAWREVIRLVYGEGDRLVAVWVIHPFYDC